MRADVQLSEKDGVLAHRLEMAQLGVADASHRRLEANDVPDNVSCWACRGPLGLGARFCSSCGARVDTSADTRQQPEGYQPCERRQLTVMFCDLADSTKLSLELDPEDFTAVVRTYRDVCAQIARSWKGYLSRNVGDGVLVYFGYPQASEDDALRGVSAAWELSHAIPKLGLLNDFARERAPNATPQLQVRISLHTGLAIVGDVVGRFSAESHDVLGAAPNIAAKLQALAQPGEVVVSETTAALLPPTFEIRPLLDKAGPAGVRAGVVSKVPHGHVRARAAPAELFVGRSAQLNRVLGKILNHPHEAKALVLIGESGVGKSRFLQEVIKHSEPKFPVCIELACIPYGQTSPLHPFSSWLPVDDARSGMMSGAEPLLRSPFDNRRRIFDHLMAEIFSRGPHVAIVLEDMQWADSTTIDFAAELIEKADPGSLLVLMASRQPLNVRLMRSPCVYAETLDRLLPGDAAVLARALSITRPLSALEIAEIVDRADGIPLFIEQFVKIKSSSAHAKDSSDHIPESLRDALMGALDNLGVGRAIALTASVFGRRFRCSQLRSLLDVNDVELTSALDALKEAKILVQKDHGTDPSFEFYHALLRDTAYQTLLKGERERLHLRLAGLGQNLQEATPELLAVHFSLGKSYRKAIEYWLMAAAGAMGRSANAEALDHIKRGLEDCRALTSEDEIEAARLELELLRNLAAPLVAVSGWSSPDLERIYARATVLCKLVGSQDAEFDFARGRYNLHLLRSEVRTADLIADRMLAMAQQCGDADKQRAHFLEAWRSKGLAAFYAARYGEARSSLEQMTSLYDTTKHASHAFYYGTEPDIMAQSYLAWMDTIEGRKDSSEIRIANALGRARKLGHAFSLCYALCFAASNAQLARRIDAAASFADEAVRVANDHNFQYWLAWGEALLGWVEGHQDPVLGIQRIDAACASYRATGSSLVLPYFQSLACSLAKSAGIEEAAIREAELRQRATETGVRFWERALALSVSA